MAIQLQPEERDPKRFNDAIRQLVEGRMNATSFVTLTPAATLTVVDWPNCSVDSHILLMPRTANAAAALATTYIAVADIVQGSFTITHANNAQVDRIFSFLCIGG
jgi:hypothetical protein